MGYGSSVDRRSWETEDAAPSSSVRRRRYRSDIWPCKRAYAVIVLRELLFRQFRKGHSPKFACKGLQRWWEALGLVYSGVAY